MAAPVDEAGAMDSVAEYEGIGLSGLGRGAGGLGAGRGTATKPKASPAPVKRVSRSAAAESGTRPQLAAGVKAGEWDDNANFREFSKYLAQKRQELKFSELPLDARRFVVVTDSHGKGIPNCEVTIQDAQRRHVRLTTTASGRALLFPRAEGLKGSSMQASTGCLGDQVSTRFTLGKVDGVVELRLAKARSLPQHRTVDVVFILDTTGSMAEEISALTGTIAEVADALAKQNVQPRLGLVEYKDVTDGYVTRLHQMTTDVTGFTHRVANIRATGGGDMPEHVNAGLRVAIEKMNWNPDSLARVAFLIGDAPPQLGYAQDVGYATSVKRASRLGIQLFTIAASGMDALGQVVWRQIAQYTGGTNMFVLRGGAGPQSSGAGDAESSCGGTHKDYTSGNLAALITVKVDQRLREVDADPMRIAGLFKDEKAKPCAQRVTLAR
jgi:Mg-chelatase subunit ChlD